MYDRENDLSLNENRFTILLNSHAKEMPPELRGLFEYMNEGTVTESDSLIAGIDKVVKKYADGKVGTAIMKWEHDYERTVRKLEEAEAKAQQLSEDNKRLSEDIKRLADRVAELEDLIRKSGLTCD